jgi:hypothetical protein
MMTFLDGVAMDQEKRYGQALTIYNGARPVGLLDSPPIISFSVQDQNPSTPPPPPSFETDLLRIDGNRYVVKDIAGVERQVLVGKDTEISGQAKADDRIQVWVQPDGHAQTIIIVMSGTQ